MAKVFIMEVTDLDGTKYQYKITSKYLREKLLNINDNTIEVDNTFSRAEQEDTRRLLEKLIKDYSYEEVIIDANFVKEKIRENLTEDLYSVFESLLVIQRSHWITLIYLSFIEKITIEDIKRFLLEDNIQNRTEMLIYLLKEDENLIDIKNAFSVFLSKCSNFNELTSFDGYNNYFLKNLSELDFKYLYDLVDYAKEISICINFPNYIIYELCFMLDFQSNKKLANTLGWSWYDIRKPRSEFLIKDIWSEEIGEISSWDRFWSATGAKFKDLGKDIADSLERLNKSTTNYDSTSQYANSIASFFVGIIENAQKPSKADNNYTSLLENLSSPLKEYFNISEDFFLYNYILIFFYIFFFQIQENNFKKEFENKDEKIDTNIYEKIEGLFWSFPIEARISISKDTEKIKNSLYGIFSRKIEIIEKNKLIEFFKEELNGILDNKKWSIDDLKYFQKIDSNENNAFKSILTNCIDFTYTSTKEEVESIINNFFQSNFAEEDKFLIEKEIPIETLIKINSSLRFFSFFNYLNQVLAKKENNKLKLFFSFSNFFNNIVKDKLNKKNRENKNYRFSEEKILLSDNIYLEINNLISLINEVENEILEDEGFSSKGIAGILYKKLIKIIFKSFKDYLSSSNDSGSYPDISYLTESVDFFDFYHFSRILLSIFSNFEDFSKGVIEDLSSLNLVGVNGLKDIFNNLTILSKTFYGNTDTTGMDGEWNV